MLYTYFILIYVIVYAEESYDVDNLSKLIRTVDK